MINRFLAGVGLNGDVATIKPGDLPTDCQELGDGFECPTRLGMFEKLVSLAKAIVVGEAEMDAEIQKLRQATAENLPMGNKGGVWQAES